MNALETLGAVTPGPSEGASWLTHWHWLVPRDFQVICVTALGDSFLRDPHASVWWLDAGSGNLELVGTQADWETKLHDASQVDQWSGRVLVRRLEAAGLMLGPGDCYTYWRSPVLGGPYEPFNFKVVPIQTHFDIWGPILGKIKDLPDGTEVELKGAS